MENIVKKEWFETWFDSRYYEILYRHRDEDEAASFLDNLIEHLALKTDAKIYDVACGKGRHSQYLNKKGFDVTGTDLSKRNIKHNRTFENEKLSFYQHDMREMFMVNYFDAVLNLFTSFGYFEKASDNTKAMRSMYSAIKPGGHLVMDYMNTNRVISKLSPKEHKEIDGIGFDIRREVEDGFIWKHIEVKDGENKFHFVEKVEAFTSDILVEYFTKAGLTEIELFGDYDLNEFQSESSPRLILVGKKH